MNYIWVDDYEGKVRELEYENRDIDADDVLPRTEDLQLADVQITYESLHMWFEKYSIVVFEWASLEAYTSTAPVAHPKKKRNTTKSSETRLAIFGAVVTALAKTKPKFILNGGINAKEIITYLERTLTGIAQYATIEKAISPAIKKFNDLHDRSNT